MTTTQSMLVSAIAAPSRALLGLGEALCKDVDPAKAGAKPKGVDANHPVFIYGHLSIYPDMVLGAIGRSDLVDPKSEQWHEHFMHGKDCKDGCGDYPSFKEVVAHWKNRYETAINALADVDESAFAGECPFEGLRSRCATLGDMVNFMLVMHTSFHLGQMSTWRRCVGMSPASL
ncbi:MAG: DinB family protein [Phycisphaeraceae bacterium]|nr:DinB family protein [Phycisphaeraceae bacterium]MCB9847231.1 DinB family protein [Phycisphaeraceae bacterium]